MKVSGTENDDYLAHFITKEFVDAEAETMQQVSPGLLKQGTCSDSGASGKLMCDVL